MNIYDEEQRDRAELSHIKETQGLRNEIKALKQSNAELDHQLANYKAADGTTHWCAECKMKQDRFAEMEKAPRKLRQQNGIRHVPRFE